MRPFVGLHPLDLVVKEGEIFGFIGPNGAGKTTTIKILMGIHAATSGEATIFGRSHADPESRRSVGFLPERPYFYQHLTGREILDFYAQLCEVPSAERGPRIARLLERVELGRFADLPLRSYSKGMLQRVGLCQALIQDPRLVVLDEPMSGLDPLGRALVRDLIFEERAAGRTVFFSSHILHDVETISDRVAILVGGRLRGVGTIPELLDGSVRATEIRVNLPQGASLPPAWTAARLREEAGCTYLQVDPEQTDAALGALLAMGAHIVGVSPIRESLERLLVSEVERARPVREQDVGVLS